MKSKIRNSFLLMYLITCLLLVGCGNGSSGADASHTTSTGDMPANTSTVVRPGKLAVSQMEGLSKPVFKNVTSTTATTFDLGTIKASRDFYFILSNSGDVPVTNIQITSLNSNFLVSPSAIDTIRPQKDNYLTPLLRVTAKHGIVLDGTGYTNSLLPMGNNTCVLRITGKTKDRDDEVQVIMNVTLKVNAEVMDIALLDYVTPLDMYNPVAIVSSGLGSDIPLFRCGTPVIKNTGNVDVLVINRSNDYSTNWPLLEQFTLHPNEAHELVYPRSGITLKLTGDNTIADYTKFKLKPDGSMFFMITR